MLNRSGSRWVAVIALLCSTHPLSAQQPSQAQVQAALGQPGNADAILARIKDSGLTPEQIRARLQASGYDSNLLDPFLGDSSALKPPRTVTDSQRAAIKALGLAPATPAPIPVDTGVRRAPERPPSGVFGVDVFRRSTTQFLPLLSGPVPPDYRLGPGDVLVLILTGDVELTYQLPVTREGFVLIPQVGQIFLADLTLDQARNVLYDRLGRVYSGVHRGANATTQFDLSVASVRAVQVHVVGEVNQPSAYQVSALGTVLTALYTAGGITERANPRAVAVRRNGTTVATFDLYDYLLKGDTRNDVRLENGDVVYVGVRQRRVTVRGSVLRPASYDVAANETLADLLAAAGGLDADAARTRVSIERVVPPAQRLAGGSQRVTIDVPLPGGTIPPFAVEDGDTVRVFGVGDAVRNYVDIRGSVYLPGKFGIEPGLTLSRLIARAGGLQPGTYAGRAHISRIDQADQTRRIIPVALPADSGAPWAADPLLEDRDSIVIYSRLDMRPLRTVSIVGAVLKPAAVEWRDGMTLRDLVLEAHGLVPGASLDSAEIARLPTDRSGGQLAITLRVPLDSTYLFDRDSLGRYIGPPGTSFRRSGAPEVALQPWDNVLIFRQPDFAYQRVITIGGEVRFPGTYSLRTKTDHLTEIIARAGGLTDRAYPAGIRFIREVDSVGQLDVDLPRALRKPGSDQDIVLRPGDRITIPEYQPSVRIEGAVNSPGSVLWEPGKDLNYYLGAAGGVAQNGNRDRASVRHANGKTETQQGGFLFFAGRAPTPTPGSVVSVPIKPDRPPRDNLTVFATIATMLASTATIIIALIKL
jgi:protein involved in polysaccharide export with SLBB domain